MTDRSLILIGGPDTGKTNYLARFWQAARSRKGTLVAPQIPGDVSYVETALAHLLSGEFAPRSDTASDEGSSFALSVVAGEGETGFSAEVMVPDVSGELWSKAVEHFELPVEWMRRLREADGALLFIRIGSPENRAPLDWVTSARLLSFLETDPAAVQIDAPNAGAEEVDILNENAGPEEQDQDMVIDPGLPTQVALCELLRYLERALGRDRDDAPAPRLAIVVTAWDALDEVRAAKGPRAYIADEFPLLDGKLDDIADIEVEIFGTSIVDGDFIEDAFRDRFFVADIDDLGTVVTGGGKTLRKTKDLTSPVAWVLGIPTSES